MSRIVATITTSVDGYIAGPHDGPGRGLGERGERLHHWVFGGPWTYEDAERVGTLGEPVGEDAAFLQEGLQRIGAVVGGRGTYEAAEHWGGANPFGMPFFVVTHRPDDAPDDGFTFVGSIEEAVARAADAAGDKDVSVMGGADVIRQALKAGLVDELTISIAPVILGRGKRLFERFDEDIELEPIGVRQSPFATHVSYRVKR
jgi:dihydrofolate reductase